MSEEYQRLQEAASAVESEIRERVHVRDCEADCKLKKSTEENVESVLNW